MSTNYEYLLSYENQSYMSPTPMEKDMEILKNEFPNHIITEIYEYLFFFSPERGEIDISNIKADQIIKREECGIWKIIR